MKHINFERLKKVNLNIRTAMAVLLIAAVYITAVRILPLASSTDKKRVVVLDAGHGGSDSGKISVTGSLEKNLNLSITLELKTILEDAGYEVILTRKDEDGLYTEKDRNRKIADMKERCTMYTGVFQRQSEP